MNEQLITLNRLRKSLKDIEISNFLNNYFIQNNLPFSKDRRGLLNIYPELKQVSQIYFSNPLELLENSNNIKSYYIGGFEWLNNTISASEKQDFKNLHKDFQKATTPLIKFYDGLTSLAKIYAHHKDIKPIELLNDEKSMKEIHKKISTPQSYQNIEEKRWNLYISLIKLLPEIEETYTDFFNELSTESAEAMKPTVGYADRFDKNAEFFYPKIQDIAETLIKSKKINFSELEEGLRFFKECYHDRVVKHNLITYF